MEGILVINKPQEWTSHDCVAGVQTRDRCEKSRARWHA